MNAEHLSEQAESSSDGKRKAASAGDARPRWSVIVIARNEEANIQRCLESVHRAMHQRAHEILLVDSASTDRTGDIGRSLGVTVITIPRHYPLSPAAGRHVGFKRSTGTYLLFMDGDSILDPAWIDSAEDAFGNPRVAGVAGAREIIERRTGRIVTANQYGGPQTGIVASECLGGPAAYSRNALDQVGGFNPFLRAYEEPELGTRLTHGGFLLLRLPTRMTTHNVEHREETFAELFRRVRAGYPYGRGQLLRHALQLGRVTRLHTEGLDRLAIFGALICVAIVGVAIDSLTGDRRLLIASAAGFLLLYAAFALRARGLRKPTYYFLEWAIHSVMFLRGFLMTPRRAEEYPEVPAKKNMVDASGWQNRMSALRPEERAAHRDDR
jgi:glycosyltransferase involved in cell wall biosynthesis